MQAHSSTTQTDVEGDEELQRQPSNVIQAIEEHWTLESLLGVGSQAKAWAATSKKTIERVAVRLMKMSPDALREIEVLHQLHKFPLHRNIVEIQFGLTNE